MATGSQPKARYLILMGPPGAGKGTQAQRVASRIGLKHIATGDLFREAMAKQTELGKQAEAYVKSGRYVPDAITLGLVEERLAQPDCAGGVLLDGFPRTPDQATGLDGLLARLGGALSAVVYLDVPLDALMQRLTGRWTCRACQAVFHEVFNPPAEAGKCDKCGGELYQRPDDTTAVVTNRLSVYTAQTAPLIAYYESRGVLLRVDGSKSPDEVTTAVLAVIG